MEIADLGEGVEVDAMHEIRIDRPLLPDRIIFAVEEDALTFSEWARARGYDSARRCYRPVASPVGPGLASAWS
jgi:hypothetical protein